ncbi:serine protease inhibitor dipetalogastin-like isoform X2 [Andrena cerasifolii]|uniref:serine protease inhibitor dipetalogastin-like isoform X2 n=1 Tax=Andrena cerasifolii TaxID=2819439 RepID=UPI00403791D2
MKRILSFLGILLASKGAWCLSWADKAILYEDCEIFNNSRIYGGPICGSNGVTYANSLYLDCANHQNFQNVATLHSGACLPGDEYCKTNILYEPVCGSDGATYTNLESLLCVNYRRLRNVTVASHSACGNFDYCYRHGTASYGTNPVCGSNGFTYQNAAQVKCLQRRNTELKILHDGGCTVRDVHAVYGSTAEVCEIARSRYEWNPVCTSDGVTLSNPFEFLCYEADLKQLVADEECGTSTQRSCSWLRVDDATLMSGNETSTLGNEVCGSDGVTYGSMHHLQCQTSRNKYLFTKHSGPCSGPDDNPCGSIPEEDLRLPVCGSDGVSYVSPEALWCGRRRFPEKNLTFVHDGPC